MDDHTRDIMHQAPTPREQEEKEAQQRKLEEEKKRGEKTEEK